MGERLILAEVSTGGMQSFLKGNILPLILLIICAGMLFHAKSGDTSKTVKMWGPLALGLVLLGLVVTGQWENVAVWGVRLITG